MAIVVESVTTTSSGARTLVSNFDMPSLRPDGDYYVCVAGFGEDANLSVSGWETVHTDNDGSNLGGGAFGRVGDNEPSSYGISAGGGAFGRWAMAVLRLSGQAASSIVMEEGIASGGSGTITAPAVTPPASGGLVIRWAVVDPDTSPSIPSGHTSQASVSPSTGADDVELVVVTRDDESVAGVSTGTASFGSASGGGWIAGTLIIAPPLPPVVVTPGTLSLSTTTFAPSPALVANKQVVPDPIALETTPNAPTVSATDHQTVEPDSLALETDSSAPAVTASDHKSVEPGTLALLSQTYAPGVLLSDHKLVVPGALGLATTLYAPGVEATANRLVVPETLGLVTQGYAPEITASGGEVEVEIDIADGDDDAHDTAGGPFDAGEDYVQIDFVGNPIFNGGRGGFRFLAGIPVGATITSAKLTLVATDTSNDDMMAHIFLEAIDDAPDFATNPTLTRTLTSAKTLWEASGLGTGRVESPDFSAALQEWVDRPGRASGHAMVVILWFDWDNTGLPSSTSFRAVSYEGNPSNAAKLLVTYTMPGPVTVAPGTLALTTTAYAPSIVTPRLVTPSTLALDSVAYAPSIALSDNQFVIPETLALTTVAYAPSVVASDHQTVTPGLLELAISAFAPGVFAGQTATPGTLALSTQGFAPSIALSDNKLIVPDPLSLSIAGFSPDVLTPQTVTPDTLALALTEYAPDVDATENVRVIPGLLELATLGYAPVVTPTLHVLVRPNGAELAIVTYAPRAIVPRYLGTIRPKSGFSLAQPRPSAGGALSQPRPRGGSSLRQPRPRW